MSTQKEWILQKDCIDWMRYARPRWFLTAASRPNEGKRTVQYTQKLKAMGLKAGFPDFDFTPAHGQRVFIEFKRKGGKARKDQDEIHESLQAAGHEVYVIDDFDNFVALCQKWPYI